MMLAFGNKFGRHIPDEKIPAQTCHEAFANKLAIGALRAEPLAMVVSLYDMEHQERNKPEQERQYGLTLDSKPTITTKKRVVSAEPANEKELREKYAILTNLWLLGQMKQPGRNIYHDFERTTFLDFLEKLLDKQSFNLHKEVNGSSLLVPNVLERKVTDLQREVRGRSRSPLRRAGNKALTGAPNKKKQNSRRRSNKYSGKALPKASTR